MRRSWVYDKDGKAHERVQESTIEHHYIQPDISEHGGRAKWRERLKQNGSIEMSPREMHEASQKFRAKKAEFEAKIEAGRKYTTPRADVDVMESKPYEMSRLNKEVANRLDGRPVPDRKMLIKMTLETARMLRGQ